MRLQEIIHILRNYFFVALMVITLLGIIFFLAYFVVYRKLLKGQKRLPIKSLLVGGLFTGYVVMVIGPQVIMEEWISLFLVHIEKLGIILV